MFIFIATFNNSIIIYFRFVTKPVVGVFDLASNVTEGIRNTTTVFDEK
jgi:hypothetical protein